jgi:transglutaminase-like putative cysteine protease
MSILAGLHHVTRYRYDRPVEISPHVVRLRPALHCRSRIVSYSLEVTPRPHFVNWQQDPNGNWLARYVFPEKARELAVAVDLVADMAVPSISSSSRSPRAFPSRIRPSSPRNSRPIFMPRPPGRACTISSPRSAASGATPSTFW